MSAFPLSLRQVEDLLHERGIDIGHETIRAWWNRFGPMFAAEIKKKRSASMRRMPQWRELPKDFPPRSTVYNYFWEWSRYGVLDRMHHALLVRCREAEGREASLSAAIIVDQHENVTPTPIAPKPLNI